MASHDRSRPSALLKRNLRADLAVTTDLTKAKTTLVRNRPAVTTKTTGLRPGKDAIRQPLLQTSAANTCVRWTRSWDTARSRPVRGANALKAIRGGMVPTLKRALTRFLTNRARTAPTSATICHARSTLTQMGSLTAPPQARKPSGATRGFL